MCAVLLGVPPVVWAGGSVRAAVAGVGNVSLASTVTPATLGLGSGFDDVATLTPPQGGARPTGTMSFTVYGPTDPTCAGPILFDSTNTVSSTPGLSGGFSTTSGSYTPPNVGTYRVISTYSGDANYQRTSTGCGDPAQTVTVGLGPTVTAISPGAGPAGGANTVTITGTNLAGATTVDFGGAATPATVLSATQVAATAPAGSGTVDVTVTTPFGTSPTGAVDRYTFAPAAGPPATPVAIGVVGQAPVVETGSARNVTAASAELTGTVDPEGQVTTAHFEYTVRLPGGVTRTARTPEQSIGVIPVAVSADATGLVAGSRYRVRLIATNAAGITTGPATSFATPSGSRAPAPVLGRTFVAQPVSGLVYFRLPAGKIVVPLTAARQLPVGTTLDTRTGVARLTTASAAAGPAQSGSFTGATFRLLQATTGPSPAELQFVRASTAHAICATHSGHAPPATDLGLLHATVTGRFEIAGHDGSASGRAATWTTTDRCDGLLTTVSSGNVSVDDFGAGRRVAVARGHAYLAKTR